MSEIAEQLKFLAIPINTIKTDPKNARLHSDLNLNVIKKSLEIYGQRKPIVVNKNTGLIEAGNGLYLAAKALGWQNKIINWYRGADGNVIYAGFEISPKTRSFERKPDIFERYIGC